MLVTLATHKSLAKQLLPEEIASAVSSRTLSAQCAEGKKSFCNLNHHQSSELMATHQNARQISSCEALCKISPAPRRNSASIQSRPAHPWSLRRPCRTHPLTHPRRHVCVQNPPSDYIRLPFHLTFTSTSTPLLYRYTTTVLYSSTKILQ